MVPDDPDGWPAPAGLPGSVAQAALGPVQGVWDGVGLYWLQTLGCPKNQVDSDKLEGYLAAQGYDRAQTRKRPISLWSTPAPSSTPPARNRSKPS